MNIIGIVDELRRQLRADLFAHARPSRCRSVLVLPQPSFFAGPSAQVAPAQLVAALRLFLGLR